jgi:hypothetical protein
MQRNIDELQAGALNSKRQVKVCSVVEEQIVSTAEQHSLTVTGQQQAVAMLAVTAGDHAQTQTYRSSCGRNNYSSPKLGYCSFLSHQRAGSVVNVVSLGFCTPGLGFCTLDCWSQ